MVYYIFSLLLRPSHFWHLFNMIICEVGKHVASNFFSLLANVVCAFVCWQLWKFYSYKMLEHVLIHLTCLVKLPNTLLRKTFALHALKVFHVFAFAFDHLQALVHWTNHFSMLNVGYFHRMRLDFSVMSIFQRSYFISIRLIFGLKLLCIKYAMENMCEASIEAQHFGFLLHSDGSICPTKYKSS